MLRGRAHASGWWRRDRRLWRHSRSCGHRRRWHLHPRKWRRSCLGWRPRRNRGSRQDGCGWFRLSWSLGCNRRSNNARWNGPLFWRFDNFRNWRLRFLVVSCGNKIGKLLRRNVRSNARRRHDRWRGAYRIRSFLHCWRSRSRYLDGLGVNRGTNGLRRFVNRLCNRRRSRDLAPEFQQFTMQGIVLLGVQFGQILQLQTKFILLPGAQPDCSQSEHDTYCWSLRANTAITTRTSSSIGTPPYVRDSVA